MLVKKTEVANNELKETLRTIISSTTKISSVEAQVITTLEKVKRTGINNIGYISGVISSDGVKYIPANVKVLDMYTEFYRAYTPFPVFSSSDIFYGRYTEKFNLTQSEWFSFWNNILKSKTITDVFMTPRWEVSKGAIEEHKTAKELSLKIHYHHKHVDLNRILRNIRRDLESA